MAIKLGDYASNLSKSFESLSNTISFFKQNINTNQKRIAIIKADKNILVDKKTDIINKIEKANSILVNKIEENKELLKQIFPISNAGIKKAIIANKLAISTINVDNKMIKKTMKKLKTIQKSINNTRTRSFNKQTRKIRKIFGNPLIDFNLCKSDNLARKTRKLTINDLDIQAFPKKLPKKTRTKSFQKSFQKSFKKSLANFFE